MIFEMLMTVGLMVVMLGACESARILALMPFNSRSHWIVEEPLLQALAARGHQVTVFTTFPQKQPLPNYTDVDFSHILQPLTNKFSIEVIKNVMPNPWKCALIMNEVNEVICSLIKEREFQDILKSKDKYDLVLTELLGTDCLTYFAYKLQVPLISFTTSLAMPWAAERFGLPDNPSYIPNYLVSFPPEMTLWQRLYNTVVLLYAKFWHQWVFSGRTRAQVEEAFGEPLPPVSEVVANTSLYFINSYHALTQSRPFPPNVVEVGGIHIKERQPLPPDIKKILDEASNGVIVMSFGSLVRSSSIPMYKIRMFMNVFSNIKQTVFFKYEEDLPDAPPNVLVRKWLPQRDMIEHENVVAVIAHGGLASTVEAVFFNKPLVGIPFFADQYANIMRVAQKNAAVELDLNDLSEDKIARAVKEITTNNKYKDGMRRLSEQFRDRPMTALQSAVYWTEYVIRHQGAPHLRPASVNLPLHQYLLLDVIALLLLALIVTVAALYYTIKYLINILFRKQYKKFPYPKKIR